MQSSATNKYNDPLHAAETLMYQRVELDTYELKLATDMLRQRSQNCLQTKFTKPLTKKTGAEQMIRFNHVISAQLSSRAWKSDTYAHLVNDQIQEYIDILDKYIHNYLEQNPKKIQKIEAKVIEYEQANKL